LGRGSAAQSATHRPTTLEIGMNVGVIPALVCVAVTAIGPGARAEDKFQKLTGSQIQARFAGMEVTDQVHWNDFYQAGGVLVSNEMGHKSTGKWRIQKDQLCLDRGRELGSGCYEVWLSGKNVQLKTKDSNLPLEGVLEKPKDRH
jgi:hypothetical protein